MSRCALLLLVLWCVCCKLQLSSAQATGAKCSGGDSCVCTTPEGDINLHSAASDDGSPRYTNLLDANNYAYDYNPCKPFTTQGECANVHVCQKTTYEPILTYDIADAGTEEMWIDTTGQVYLYYVGPEFRETFVRLTCDKSVTTPKLTTEGDYGHYYTYEFTWTSCHACPGGCGGAGGGAAAGTVGILLMLFLILGVAGYFVVGSLVMKFRFNKTGTDIIPNKLFWFAVPGLIKEGCIFTFRPIVNLIRGRGGGGGGYQQQL